MTAHELARKLLDGPDLTVTVRGYEGGVNVVGALAEPQLLHMNVNTEWYYGKHEYCFGEPCDRCKLTLNGEPINTVQAIQLGVAVEDTNTD